MPDRALRALTVADLLVLSAATSVGFAWTRYEFSYIQQAGTSTEIELSLLSRLSLWQFVPTPCLTVWSVALLVLMCLKPRPALRELLNRPGPVACGVVILILTTQAFCLAFGGASLAPYNGFERLTHQLPLTGIAVAGAWFALTASGAWRSDPSGLDRLGRAAGSAWILLFLIETCLYYI
jgi:hypothetical protein